MDILIEDLNQKTQKLRDDIESFRNKLIDTYNDYDCINKVIQSYRDGKINFKTYIKKVNECREIIGKRWNLD
mgnify:CR=1 FL=1